MNEEDRKAHNRTELSRIEGRSKEKVVSQCFNLYIADLVVKAPLTWTDEDSIDALDELGQVLPRLMDKVQEELRKKFPDLEIDWGPVL